jgi:nucleotide-binding universal stress UspA family protein
MSSGIVVGYDGSDCAKEAVRVAIEVGKAYAETVVIAFGYDLNPVAGELHDYHAALKELATTRLTEAVALAQASGADADIEAVIIEQEPAAGLVELARERDARAIVVGTRGGSPLKGALLGSTPHKLLQLSDRPVLVVPSHD